MTYDQILKEMNARLNELGISRYELSKESGIDQATIKRILEGDRIPSVKLWLKLIDALGLNLRLYIRSER